MTQRLWAALEARRHSDPHVQNKEDQFQEQSWWEESLFCRHLTGLFWISQTVMSEMQASMVRERVKASEGESDFYSSVSSANMWWETEWWLITSERGWVYRMKELVPRRNPGGPHKSEVKERVLFHSQLLLVSYLAGRNGRRTGQDHEYQKCFRGESEECYGRLSKAALRSKSVRIEPEPDNRV